MCGSWFFTTENLDFHESLRIKGLYFLVKEQKFTGKGGGKKEKRLNRFMSFPS